MGRGITLWLLIDSHPEMGISIAYNEGTTAGPGVTETHRKKPWPVGSGTCKDLR